MSTRSDIISKKIETYIESHQSPVDETVMALQKASLDLPQGDIQSSLSHVNLFDILLKTLNARRVLEVGTFTGFCALAMAQALPADGQVVTCEQDESRIEFGRPYWEKAGMADKIHVRLGPALESLKALISEKVAPFDFCYIDANKSQYPEYYQHCFDLTREGGIIALDNTLFYGEVLEAPKNNSVRGIQQANTIIAQDRAVTSVILPMSDGLTLVRKEACRG